MNNSKDILIKELVIYLTKRLCDDYGYSVQKALSTVYNSDTYTLMTLDNSEEYLEGPLYVFDDLKAELFTGKTLLEY